MLVTTVLIRASTILLFCLLGPAAICAQSKPPFEKVGEVRFTEAEGVILARHVLESENKIILVTAKAMRVVDMATANVVAFRALDTPTPPEDNRRVISPSGRHVIVFGNYDARGKENKVKRQPAVWDLGTGKQIATLERDKAVRAAGWSKDGSTIWTSSDKYSPHFTDDRSIEISFWDGKTFEYLSSLPADKINWWHVSDDGSKCLFSTAPITNWLYIMRFIGERGGAIHMWDIRQKQMDQTLPVSQTATLTNTRAIRVSPDGRYLAYIAEKPKAKDDEKRLVVSELVDNPASFQVKARYEVTPTPKLSQYGVHFSDDAEYFVFDAGKTLQIYETLTGQKKFELAKDETPSYWLDDNRILLYGEGDELVARDIATGAVRYREKVVFVTSSYYANPEDTIPTNEVVDWTRVVPHPDGKTFLSYSKQYVKFHDALTGSVLQMVIEPAIDPSKRVDPKKGPKRDTAPLVTSAAWTTNGNGFYVVSHDERSVSFWRRREGN